MGFWSFLGGSTNTFAFSETPPSSHLEAALREAAKRPLSDFTFRLVVAAPARQFVVDVSVMRMSHAFDGYEKAGVDKARREAMKVISEAVRNGVRTEEEEDFLAYVALAMFDTAFTRGANQGKNAATAWNTLTLDLTGSSDAWKVTRGARRLDFADGPIDLSLDPLGVLGGLFGR